MEDTSIDIASLGASRRKHTLRDNDLHLRHPRLTLQWKEKHAYDWGASYNPWIVVRLGLIFYWP